MTTSYTGLPGEPAAGRTRTRIFGLVICAAVVLVAMVMLSIARPSAHGPARSRFYRRSRCVISACTSRTLPARTLAWTNSRRPSAGNRTSCCYYNPWLEPFQVGFATSAAKHGAVTLVQIDPDECFAGKHRQPGSTTPICGHTPTTVKAFGGSGDLVVRSRDERQLVLLGLPAHIPGGFVAAWRHVVTMFRAAGCRGT